MTDNEAQKKIFALISEAENNFKVPNCMLRKIYELEESLIHLRTRDTNKRINKIIANAIEMSDNNKLQNSSINYSY